MENIKMNNPLDALLFIDTNIFLDFYRIRKSDISLKYLKNIENNIDKIISTSQVEMEFKKNRQSVILESISEINKIGNLNTNVPVILSDQKDLEMLERSKKAFLKRQKNLKNKIEKVLKTPKRYDLVYKSLEKIFNYKSDIILNQNNKERYKIHYLAKKRFILGYPPRKKSDNSIGDAINWEWIIKCAEITGKHIILVSRDNDFGCKYENDSYLNDWLLQEFKDRINYKRKIILTEKLSYAFKILKIPVTLEMEKEEEKILNKNIIDNNIINAMISMQKNLSQNKNSFSEIQRAQNIIRYFLNNNEDFNIDK